jgi:hypothetical protein
MFVAMLLGGCCTISPTVELFSETNNVWGRVGEPSVKLLGSFDSNDACSRACSTLGRKCGSFVWHEASFPDPSFARHCYGLTTGYFDWFPTKSSKVVSGRMEWPCERNTDCSLNGRCIGGKCICRPGWEGHACQKLAVAPVNPEILGLRSTVSGKNASTWGSSVFYDQGTQLWHMWASEMTHNCGMDTWCHNSRIIHATSRAAVGPYTRQDVVFDVFAHEPTVVRDPRNGSFVMFFTGQRPAVRKECTVCADGVTIQSCDSGNECSPDTDATWMAYARSSNGPWSEPVIVLNNTGSDTNLSPVIFPNGSLHAMWRSFAPTPSHNW